MPYFNFQVGYLLGEQFLTVAAEATASSIKNAGGTIRFLSYMAAILYLSDLYDSTWNDVRWACVCFVLAHNVSHKW